MRLEWTLQEFYADGGVVTFTDRLAAVLGIHASTIKVVAVYQGSVVVEFMITNTATTGQIIDLPSVQTKLTAATKVGSTSLGAPVLEASSSYAGATVTDGSN